MARMLRPGCVPLLADHVVASPRIARPAQALVEIADVPAAASISGAARSGT
ncbi:MAG: hypothetical protein M0030_04120 [Actinomycetota bacterium]|nr:hypothetical protein [Actinomycetota bacterium]